MDVILKASVVANAPDRWRETYASWEASDTEKHIKTEKLQALKGTAFTAEQVDEIIGNKSWTEITCDECEKPAEALACFGDDHRQMDLCTACLSRAITAIADAKEPA